MRPADCLENRAELICWISDALRLPGEELGLSPRCPSAQKLTPPPACFITAFGSVQQGG